MVLRAAYGRSAALPSHVIHRPVPRDRGRPAAEPIAITGEGPKIPSDLQPGLGRHILGAVTDHHLQVTQQPGLDRAIQQPKRVLVAVLRISDRGREVHIASMPGPAGLNAHSYHRWP